MVECSESIEMYLGYIVCFFHLWWFSCCGLSGEHSALVLGLFAFEIHSSHAHHCLMFKCFTQCSPKTENWSNFSIFQISTFKENLDLKTLTTEPREKTDYRWWKVADKYMYVFYSCMVWYSYVNSNAYLYYMFRYIGIRIFGNVAIAPVWSWAGIKKGRVIWFMWQTVLPWQGHFFKWN